MVARRVRLMQAEFSPNDLILPPPEEAWVERLAGGDYLIRWRRPVEHVAVYLIDDPGSRPEGGELLIGEQVSSQSLRIRRSELAGNTSRPYFLLELDGRGFVIAERVLPLAGGVNFRDLGGYRTAGGRVVRWGRVYRSGSLAELSEADVAYLGRLGLRLSCDLRSPDESARRPDRLPPGTATLHRPVAAEVGRARRVITLITLRKRIQTLLQQVYTVMIDQNGPLFAGIVGAAADPANLPLVIHCTAGKDRTGLAAAILLLALGVPEDTVIADYTLSNSAFEELAGRMGPEMEPLYRLGFDEVQLRPFLLAEARTMTGALVHLRQRYGSVEWYLLRSGVDENVLQRLRETLLTAG
jgi:protein-tyrosine phosphatase